MRQRLAPDAAPKRVEKAAERPAAPPPRAVQRVHGLTYKEQREAEALPARIEALESEQSRLYSMMADPAIYQQGGEEVVTTKARLEKLEQELAAAYERWEELETKATE